MKLYPEDVRKALEMLEPNVPTVLGGSGSGGLDIPGGAVAGQPGGSGSGSVGVAAIMPGRSTGKVADGSGMFAAEP